LVVVDPEQKVMILNPAATRLLQLAAGDARSKPAKDILAAFPWIIETLQKTFQEKRTVSRQETELLVQGESHRFGYTTILISGPQKEALGSGILFQRL
jgi:nitrogen-specific signal transduction histidine kinase